MRALLLSLGMFCAIPVWAVNPKALSNDNRLKIIDYKPNQIVSIAAHDFVQTSVEFNQDESILDITSGDGSAWQLERSQAAPNTLFIKPQVDYSHTNLKVITDKRHYEFELKTAGQDEDITYRLIFNYPKPPKPTVAAVKSPSRHYNIRYYSHGSAEPLPMSVYDDGVFTYMKFKPNQNLPAIFAVDGRQKEKLVNFRINDDTVVVEKVTGQWTLRDGLATATLINQRIIEARAWQ